MLHQKSVPIITKKGESFRVFVRALPLSQIEEFLGKQGDFKALLDLTVDLTQLYTDDGTETKREIPLTEKDIISASTLALLEAADELNDPFGRRWMERQRALIQRAREATQKLADGALPTPSQT